MTESDLRAMALRCLKLAQLTFEPKVKHELAAISENLLARADRIKRGGPLFFFEKRTAAGGEENSNA